MSNERIAVKVMDPKVKYHHFRNVDVVVNYDPDSDYEIESTISNLGGTTVAWVEDEAGHVIKYAFAHCSENDNFDRSVGRGISAARLDIPEYIHYNNQTLNAKEFITWVNEYLSL